MNRTGFVSRTQMECRLHLTLFFLFLWFSKNNKLHDKWFWTWILYYYLICSYLFHLTLSLGAKRSNIRRTSKLIYNNLCIKYNQHMYEICKTLQWTWFPSLVLIKWNIPGPHYITHYAELQEAAVSVVKQRCAYFLCTSHFNYKVHFIISCVLPFKLRSFWSRLVQMGLMCLCPSFSA